MMQTETYDSGFSSTVAMAALSFFMVSILRAPRSALVYTSMPGSPGSCDKSALELTHGCADTTWLARPCAKCFNSRRDHCAHAC